MRASFSKHIQTYIYINIHANTNINIDIHAHKIQTFAHTNINTDIQAHSSVSSKIARLLSNICLILSDSPKAPEDQTININAQLTFESQLKLMKINQIVF